jgi:hypothetical protein
LLSRLLLLLADKLADAADLPLGAADKEPQGIVGASGLLAAAFSSPISMVARKIRERQIQTL